MLLTPLDWTLIGLYFVIALGIGLYFRRQASRSIQDFFLGGRKMPWWLAGLSMVATTFATDTPLLITELVRKNGISGNWLWWNMLIGGMLTSFFFARLWQRAAVTTDLEFISLRYSGAPARWLRGIKALYLGVVLNLLVIGWVNLALMTLLELYMPGLSDTAILLILSAAMLVTLIYASLSGLYGVVVTDGFQFILAMGGSILLAVLVLQSGEIGGIAGLQAQLPEGTLRFFPTISGGNAATEILVMGPVVFLARIGLQWWASWYPGNEPGGGGYIVQRMMATPTEGQALRATLMFQLFHYALRPWPWILVGLSTILLYPGLDAGAYRQGYVMAMRDFLPPGLQGMLLAAFFAAYMSTISTQLNWGISYVINDFYKFYIRPQAASPHYILMARLATVALVGLSLLVTTQLTSIEQTFNFLINCGAGMGFVLILRWYWWRISAWSEIVATLLPFLTYSSIVGLGQLLSPQMPYGFWIDTGTIYPFILTTFTSVAGSLAAIYLLPGTNRAHLQAFYDRVRPQGAWSPFRRSAAEATHAGQPPPTPLRIMALCWLLGVVLVYSLLFSVGKLLFSAWVSGSLYAALALSSLAGLILLERRYRIFR
jgi:Na+/proline symporter